MTFDPMTFFARMAEVWPEEVVMSKLLHIECWQALRVQRLHNGSELTLFPRYDAAATQPEFGQDASQEFCIGARHSIATPELSVCGSVGLTR